VFDNVLNRQFMPTAANQVWVSDITYIRTCSGWLYLAAVLDCYSRKVIGWAMAPNMPAELVCTALQLAISQRNPPAGLIVHSDRGSQYASQEHQQLLNRYQLQGSMSRKGNCWDNAVMERFFLNLKMERVWQRDYANHQEAIRDVTDYIVGFYNRQRLHSTLGYLSPNRYERQMTEKQLILVSLCFLLRTYRDQYSEVNRIDRQGYLIKKSGLKYELKPNYSNLRIYASY
jgi:transposase InsO family protein